MKAAKIKRHLLFLWDKIKHLCTPSWSLMKFLWVSVVVAVLVNEVSYFLQVNPTTLSGSTLYWFWQHILYVLGVAGSLVWLSWAVWRCNEKQTSDPLIAEQKREKIAEASWKEHQPLLKREYETRGGLMESLPLQFKVAGEGIHPGGTILDTLYTGRGPDVLLLGKPGSGKSTQLAALALARLPDSQDLSGRIPLLLPLASWEESGFTPSLEEWVIRKVTTYGIPAEVTRLWFSQKRVLLLLDGLDEVGPEYRESCIRAIQAYIGPPSEKKGTFIIVGARTDEYRSWPQQLQLLTKDEIEIQPFTDEFILQTLKFAHLQLPPDQQTATKELLDLLRVPLLLSMVLQLAPSPKKGVLVSFLQAIGLTEKQLTSNDIFTTYFTHQVERAKEAEQRRQDEKPKRFQHVDFEEKMRAWLHQLAAQLTMRKKKELFLEELQPDWLQQQPNKRLQSQYHLLGVVGVSVLLGILLNLVFNNLFGTSDPTYTILYGAMGGVLGWLLAPRNVSQRRILWEGGAIAGAMLLVVVGSYMLYVVFGFDHQPFTWTDWVSNVLVYAPAFGCSIILLAALRAKGIIVDAHEARQSPRFPWQFLRMSQMPRRVMSNALLVGLFVSLAALVGDTITDKTPLESAPLDFLVFTVTAAIMSYELAEVVEVIQPVETGVFRLTRFLKRLTTFTHMGSSFLVGISIFVLFSITSGLNQGDLNTLKESLQTDLTYGVQAMLLFWLLFGFYLSLSPERVENKKRSRPDQGMTLSLRNGIIVGCLLGLICYFFTVLASLNQGINVAETVATSYSALVVGIAGGFLFGLLDGGIAYFQHRLLLRLLNKTTDISFHYVELLDIGRELRMLRQLGGSYEFYHPLLQEYFVSYG